MRRRTISARSVMVEASPGYSRPHSSSALSPSGWVLSRARISLCRADSATVRPSMLSSAWSRPRSWRLLRYRLPSRAPARAPGRPEQRRPAVGPARTGGGGELEPLHAQVRLGGGHGGLDQGQGMRRDGGLGAGDVHNAQHGAGIRIMEGNGRAAPRVDGAFVVFRAGDLDAAAQGQGGAGGAGAHGRFGPVGPGNEHHAFGPAPHLGVAFDPEQPAHLVPHGHQHAAVVAGQDQELVDDRHDGGQRMLPPVLFEFFAVHRQRGLGIVRVGLQLGRAPPRLLDQAAEAGQLQIVREVTSPRESSCSWPALA